MSRRLPIPPTLKGSLRKHPLRGCCVGYKFVESTVASSLCDVGRIKIGSLAAFRQLESKNLRDDAEGENSAVSGSVEITAAQIHSDSVARQMVSFHPEAEAELTFRNVEFSAQFDFPTFCFTYANTIDAFQSIRDDENRYDSIVEIPDLFDLAEYIAAVLSARTSREICYLLLPVIYRDPKRSILQGNLPNICRAFEKPERFAPNVEGRMVFALRDNDRELTLKGFDGFLDHPSLVRAFRRASLPQ